MEKFDFARFLSDNLKSRTLNCKQGSTYALEYGSAGMVWMVKSGVLITVQNEESGKEIGTGVYNEGMLLGIVSFTGIDRCVICKMITDVELCGYQAKDVEALLKSNPEACYYAFQFACTRFKYVMDNLRINALDSITERIEKFENMLSSTEELKSVVLPDNVIATYLGIHPSSMSRARKKNPGKNKQIGNIKKPN